MKHIWKYLRHYKKALVFTFSFKFLSALTEMLIPSLLEKIVDKIIPTGSVPMVVAYGCVMAACAGFAMFSNVIANRNSERTAGSVTESLRHELFEKISHLSAAQIDHFTTPSLVSRLTSDSYNVNRMIARLQRVGVRAPILLISGLCITLLLDPVLSLVLAAMLPFVFGLIWFITRFSVPVYTGVQRRLDTMVRTVQENVTGVRVVKALSKVDYERRRFDTVNTTLADEEQHGSALMSVINPTTTLILNLGLTLIVLAGAHRANSGLTEPGKIMAFLSYFTIILNALLGISKIFLIGSKGIASARRIEEVLDAPADMAVLPAEKEPEPDAPAIAFENVCFSYNKVKHNLEGLSFRLERGQTLGIIGPTGSGKTTILNLLLRLYDPDSGTVRLDGRDIRTLSREELSHRFGVVLQNDFIMSGTIRENLDYGRNLPEADLLYAAETAQAMPFIAEKGGLDADIDIRAANLSGGQKQRLLIARALAGKPDILVLDDASSALDYKTDAAFRHALASNYPELTRVIVAQRVSSIRSADLILVLDDGKVLANGTHDSLYATCSEYRLITDAQMGGGTNA